MKLVFLAIASLLTFSTAHARLLSSENYKCLATNAMGVSVITLDAGSSNAKLTYGMASVTWKGGSILLNTGDKLRVPRASVYTASGVPLEMIFLPSQNFTSGLTRLLGVAFVPAYAGVPLATNWLLTPYGRTLPSGFLTLAPLMVGGVVTATLACDVNFKDI